MSRHTAFAVSRVIHTACSAAGGFLRAESHAGGIVLAVLVDRILHHIVIPGHVGTGEYGRPSGSGYCHKSRGVKPVAVLSQLCHYAAATVVPFHGPLLVADTPQNHRGVVAVAKHHSFKLSYVIVV